MLMNLMSSYISVLTLRLKSDDTTKDSFWVGKVDTDGDFIWNYRYVVSGGNISMLIRSSIDIFGDLNLVTFGKSCYNRWSEQH